MAIIEMTAKEFSELPIDVRARFETIEAMARELAIDIGSARVAAALTSIAGGVIRMRLKP
jgi:hypothetical protein